MKTRDMCISALMAALLCAIGPIVIPVGPVPVSLTTLVVYLAGLMPRWRRGACAVMLYLLIGAVGVPVFSGFSGGVQRLVGPTGGYLVGYLPCALLIGAVRARRTEGRRAAVAAMIAGTALLYGMGTAWFMIQTGTGLMAALGSCVLPFLPGDAMKIAAATALEPVLKRLAA